MSDDDILPVIVIGAGPTGVAVATMLADHGVPVLVLERHTDVFSQPRAVHLDDEVYRILDMLGVAGDFASVSRPALGLRLVDGSHRVLMEFDRRGVSPEGRHPRANMFDQPDLERLLREAAIGRDGLTLRGAVEVCGVTDLGSHLEVRGIDRSTGLEETWRAAYVLGCDGANSLVRDVIGSSYEDLGFEQRWLVVDVETKADLRQWEGVHQVCDPHRAGTYMRVGQTRYRWEFQLHETETAGDFASVDDLLPLIAPWVENVAPDEMELVRVAEYTFRAAVGDRWRRGAIFLLGDAAHLTPPFIGQGLGAGLRDAANLAWKLAGVIDGRFPAALLDTYESERKPHAEAMVKLARVTGVVMTGGGRAGDVVRHLAAPVLSRYPRLSRSAVDGVSPRLRRPADARVSRRDRLAGRLVPNALVEGVELDTLARGSWVLVSAEEVGTRERERFEDHGCVVVCPAVGGLGEWLRRGRSRAALIRPDRSTYLSGPDAGVVVVAALDIVVNGAVA